MMRALQQTFLLALILASPLWSTPCLGQQIRDADTSYWLNVGLGASSLGGLSGSANASAQFGRHVLSVRGTANSEGLFRDDFWDIGILYGLGSASERGLFSVGFGAALVGGSRSEGLFTGRDLIRPTIGFPLEAQFFARFLGLFGVGLYGFVNVNAEQPFAGATISLQIGRFGR